MKYSCGVCVRLSVCVCVWLSVCEWECVCELVLLIAVCVFIDGYTRLYLLSHMCRSFTQTHTCSVLCKFARIKGLAFSWPYFGVCIFAFSSVYHAKEFSVSAYACPSVCVNCVSFECACVSFYRCHRLCVCVIEVD